MRGLILLIVITPFLLLIVAELRQAFDEPPEDMLTPAQKVERVLDGVAFNTPPDLKVLIHDERVDKQKRERVTLLVLQSNVEHQPKSPRIDDKSAAVLSILQKDLPEFSFGAPIDEHASSFRMLTSNDRAWIVFSVQTENGYFSRWEQRVDMHQLIREE